MTVDLPTYIPLADAARRYRLDRAALTRLVETGRIRAVKINGSVAVAKEDLDLTSLRRVIQRDESLRGQGIRLMDASRKYGVSDANLVRWANAGYIQVLKRGPKLLVLDESDVKLVSEVFKQAREKTGSSVKAGWALKRFLGY